MQTGSFLQDRSSTVPCISSWPDGDTLESASVRTVTAAELLRSNSDINILCPSYGDEEAVTPIVEKKGLHFDTYIPENSTDSDATTPKMARTIESSDQTPTPKMGCTDDPEATTPKMKTASRSFEQAFLEGSVWPFGRIAPPRMNQPVMIFDDFNDDDENSRYSLLPQTAPANCGQTEKQTFEDYNTLHISSAMTFTLDTRLLLHAKQPLEPVPEFIRNLPLQSQTQHITATPSQEEQFEEKQQKLIDEIVGFIRDPVANINCAPVPSERVQNYIKTRFKELYEAVVGRKFSNQWHKFLQQPVVTDSVALCQVEVNRWYLRLPTDTTWQDTLRARAGEKTNKEDTLRNELVDFLSIQPEKTCSPDEFLNYFKKRLTDNEELCNLFGGTVEKGLPKRGQFVRFIKKNDSFTYDDELFIIHLRSPHQQC